MSNENTTSKQFVLRKNVCLLTPYRCGHFW